MLNFVLSIVLDSQTIVVDTSASDSEDLQRLLISALEKGSAVTMANKKILAGSQDFYDKLMSFHRIRYESTVGAGTPFCASLLRIIWSGDKVFRIQGAFSGTLGFLCSELEKKKKFSDIVQNAKNLGFTEPDPRQDLCGLDVARKALILARAIGMRIELADISIEALYPKKLDDCSIDHFMQSLSSLDEEMAKRIDEAESQGKVLRYVADINATQEKVSVGIQSVCKSSTLGSLSGTDNICTFETELYSNPLCIRGSGAGAEITAAGCLGDIVELSFI
jgi:homoserine dehydrogenase